MVAAWVRETVHRKHAWPDAGLVGEGLREFEALAVAGGDDVVLHTDLHAGNVLEARREPWLAIDPKPFVGDRAYDATQHLLNCVERLVRDPVGLVSVFSGVLEVSEERVRRWLFARLVAEPRDEWRPDNWKWKAARRLAGR